MNFVSFRIASKSFTVFKMSPLTAERIILSTRGIDFNDITDTTCCVKSMLRGISYAVVGSPIFSRTRAYFVYRRLKRGASFDEIFDAYQKVISMIPVNDLSEVASVFKQLSTLISKSDE